MFGKPAFGTDVRLRPGASQSRLIALGEKKHRRVPFRNQDLFLAQNIEVGVTAGTDADDVGEVLEKSLAM
jgi:hypothetical protein